MSTLTLNTVTVRERTEEILKILEEGVRDVFESGRFAQYLSVLSKFWHYSYRNSLLVMLQMPEATRIAGIGTWNRLGRTVKKGEHGIRILAPAPYKKELWTDQLDPLGSPIVNPDTGKTLQIRREAEVMTFKPAVVFDVSQTDGDPLPELAPELKGDIQDFDEMFKAIRSIAGCPIFIQPISGRSKGYYSLKDQHIVIRIGMSPLQTIKTALHEIAHARLHDPHNQPKDAESSKVGSQKDRRSIEVEAESIAFTVMAHFGFDTSSYSLGYVSIWSTSKELNELHSSLRIIQEESARIIDALELAMKSDSAELQLEPIAAC